MESKGLTEGLVEGVLQDSKEVRGRQRLTESQRILKKAKKKMAKQSKKRNRVK